jgi:hypothetical protein
MASLAHATIVDQPRVTPSLFDFAPLIGTAEDITSLIDDEVHRKRSNARRQADSGCTMDCHAGAPIAPYAELTREVSNAA